jgi:hypothetical protein
LAIFMWEQSLKASKPSIYFAKGLFCALALCGSFTAVAGAAIKPAAPLRYRDDIEAAQASELLGLMQSEAALLEKAIGGQLRIAVISTDDPIVGSFMAQGIFHTDMATFTKQEGGLAGFVTGGQINGQKANVCYVMLHRATAAATWRNFVEPLAKGDSMLMAAAFLTGHEVGHCLDHYETSTKLGERNNWNIGEAGAFGIQPSAWKRAGGGDITRTNWARVSGALYTDPAQTQYQERVADAFGLLWAWHRGATPKFLPILTEARIHTLSWSSHATVPALAGIEQFQAQAGTSDVGDLWTLARAMQVKAGVDSRLGDGGDKGVMLAGGPTKSIATPSLPNAIPAPAASPIQEKPLKKDDAGRIRFDSLPHFGSSMNGG